MSNFFNITSDGAHVVFSKDVIANSVSVSTLNVSDDLYINSAVYTPVGSILTYAGQTAPTGWLLCDGSEVLKNNYPRLFSIIGTLYGTSTDPTKFVLPNLGERVPVGKNGSNTLGVSGGNSSITLSTAQLPSHTHTGTTASSGGHSHTGTTDVSGSHMHTGTTDTNGSHTHGITDPGHSHTQTTTNDDFNNSGGNPPGFSADSAGSRTWSNINSATTGISVNSGGSHSHTFTSSSEGNHSHTFTSSTVSDHSHTFTTNSTGSGNSIDIRNKYIVLNYIIRF